jgi:hypothetical protein
MRIGALSPLAELMLAWLLLSFTYIGAALGRATCQTFLVFAPPTGVTFVEADAPGLRLDTHFPLSAMGRCGFRPGNRGVRDVASLPPWFAVSCRLTRNQPLHACW